MTTAPCYPRNFIPLLEEHTVQHIAAVIRWAFTITDHWVIKNSGHFCKMTVFRTMSAQYEKYMKKAQEGAEKKAKGEGSEFAPAYTPDQVVVRFQEVPRCDSASEPVAAASVREKEAKEGAALLAYLTEDGIGFDDCVEQIQFEEDDRRAGMDNESETTLDPEVNAFEPNTTLDPEAVEPRTENSVSAFDDDLEDFVIRGKNASVEHDTRSRDHKYHVHEKYKNRQPGGQNAGYHPDVKYLADRWKDWMHRDIDPALVNKWYGKWGSDKLLKAFRFVGLDDEWMEAASDPASFEKNIETIVERSQSGV